MTGEIRNNAWRGRGNALSSAFIREMEMTITQLIQSSPSKANELFSKLADTSEGAVKTREKLFSELKEELETLTSLEEKHLFPVLRKHQETKDLVSDAMSDNKEVRKLLGDLEKIPKTDPEFAPKLDQLRKIFQQHVRDEKKELLPAVRKALSDEEVQTVVEKIEAGRAKVETEKSEEKSGAKERKADVKNGSDKQEDSRQEDSKRKLAEAAARMTDASNGARKAPRDAAEETAGSAIDAGRKTAEAGRKTAEAATQAAEKITDTAAQTAQRSLRVVEASAEVARSTSEAATESTRQIADLGSRQVAKAASTMVDTTRAASDALQPMIRSFSAFSEMPGASMEMVRDVGQVWSDLVRKNFETSARASQEVFRLTSPQQLAEAQTRLAAEVLQSWMNAGARMMEISLRASGTMRTVAKGARQEAEKASSTGK